jgi:type I restriction enzyme S subunit
MSVRAPVGEIARATSDVCLGRGVCAIRFPNNFLYHHLIFKEPTWVRLSKGSTFDAVNSTDVKAFPVEMPVNEKEQTAIAEILSDMDAEISVLVAKLSKARQVKAGMMSELLTGRTRLVDDSGKLKV